MKAVQFWKALRDRIGLPPSGTRRIVLHHLGLVDGASDELQHALAGVGDRLGVNLELDPHDGDVLLLDSQFAAAVSPQLTEAYAEGRPVVVADLNGGGTRLLTLLQRMERSQQQLLDQLRELDLVRRRSALARVGGTPRAIGAKVPRADADYDSGFDSRIDAAQLASDPIGSAHWQVVQGVLRGRADPSTPPMLASYGPGANLRFDFRVGLATLDPLAQQILRARRELPQPAAGARTQPQAEVLELDVALWSLGIAAGRFPLLGAPVDWWHAPLASAPAARFERHSPVPGHLELARRLAAGPATPSELRRHARVGVGELRRFLQAALMLGLVAWLPQSGPQAR